MFAAAFAALLVGSAGSAVATRYAIGQDCKERIEVGKCVNNKRTIREIVEKPTEGAGLACQLTNNREYTIDCDCDPAFGGIGLDCPKPVKLESLHRDSKELAPLGDIRHRRILAGSISSDLNSRCGIMRCAFIHDADLSSEEWGKRKLTQRNIQGLGKDSSLLCISRLNDKTTAFVSSKVRDRQAKAMPHAKLITWETLVNDTTTWEATKRSLQFHCDYSAESKTN